MRLVRAGILALATLLALTPLAFAQWPTTCVALNDIVEAHLGNEENVGIYQRVFGEQAEQACRDDHGDDVRRVFAWAFNQTQAPAAQPVPAQPTTQLPQVPGTQWTIDIDEDPGTGATRHFAVAVSVSGDKSILLVRCNTGTNDLSIYFVWPDEFLLDLNDDGLPVEWRWNEDSHSQTANWLISTDYEAAFVPHERLTEVGYGLVHARTLAIQVMDDLPDVIASEYQFSWHGGIADHPVNQAFNACSFRI